ncbi:hypothetical protein IB75_08245 [Nitrosococcus oceani C-27]|uniref:Uncharacterized protein n=1 Tax=Nitrosococcus oceani C-27 TaxID=314279 RepID=A0A0E2ZMB9_9GAMM|nr:hypothetical protein IB75_08245 [Nitrosococcus oceani C-27]KFI22791.1 hypothetical protein HW44_07445 [Nitrosococcus oceani]GEM20989.1 hypothetical protein NONS58_24170 [Nitrosococcus oceani]
MVYSLDDLTNLLIGDRARSTVSILIEAAANALGLIGNDLRAPSKKMDQFVDSYIVSGRDLIASA